MSYINSLNQVQDEYELQRAFYSRIGINPDLSHNTDGVYQGNLFENKRSIENVNKVLSQAIKYASRIRIRGEKLPSNIILNDLLAEKVYLFQSSDFLNDIEKVYFGAASKDNDDFTTNVQPITIDYSEARGLAELLKYINESSYVRYHVDLTNIIGLSQQFYKIIPDKDKFIKKEENSEIRNPVVLADRIYPYSIADNIEFEDIMDCLNPAILQREQGAYYTPEPYVKKMHEMLYQAISEIPDGMDYIIIDRCAGTGNLEEGLPEEILRHCVLSTIEPNEYAILNYKYGDKCLVVIPNIDALQFDVIPAELSILNEVKNDFIRDIINDDKIVVILMENPPYSESGSGGTQITGKKENIWKKSYVMQEMKQDKSISGAVYNDISNLFIWSAFKFYLKKKDDSYILFSPTKPWRHQNLINKKYRDGFLCDRRQFHTTMKTAVSCIWWQNIDDFDREHIKIQPYEIDGNSIFKVNKKIILSKAISNLSKAYDNRKFEDDVDNGILCEANGTEFIDDGRVKRVRPIFNPNIIAYLKADSFAIDRKHVSLTVSGYFKGDGFFVRNDNFLEKLPLFVASVFPYDKYWFTSDVYSKSYDGRDAYLADKDFLKKCLIYTSLVSRNKCRSFLGSDNRIYRNELCLYNEQTLASKALASIINEGYSLNKIESKLIQDWHNVLELVKQTEEFEFFKSKKYPLGSWQISEEIDIKENTGKVDKKGKYIYVVKYPLLHTALKTLDVRLKNYYELEISPLLFKYQLVK